MKNLINYISTIPSAPNKKAALQAASNANSARLPAANAQPPSQL